MTSVDFVKMTFGCSGDVASRFISDFRRLDAVQYGKNIIENHLDSFDEDFDIDSISDDIYAEIASTVEDKAMSDLSTTEDRVLEEYFLIECG